jgi:hypothetical protein
MATIRLGSVRSKPHLGPSHAFALQRPTMEGCDHVTIAAMQSYAHIKERFLDQQGVELIAAHLATRAELTGGVDLLAERRDLQPAAEAILGELFADRLAPNRKVVIPIWERVGHVELTVLEAPGATTDAGLIELKWSGGDNDTIYEALWDAIKLALAQITWARYRPSCVPVDRRTKERLGFLPVR